MAQEKDKDTVVVQAIDTTWMVDLPVIELTYNKARFNSDTFIPGRMVYHSIDSTRQYSCTIRRRGGTSLLFDKAYTDVPVFSRYSPKTIFIISVNHYTTVNRYVNNVLDMCRGFGYG
jgi:hypothetical protein